MSIGVWIDVSTPKFPDIFMLVDREDAAKWCRPCDCYDICCCVKWSKDKTGYAVGKVGRKRVHYHRHVMSALKGQVVDHINRDRLDNRKQNLRFVDHRTNALNRGPLRGTSSKYQGVYWDSSKNRWKAAIRLHGRLKNLGYFDQEDEAARAFNDVAAIHLPEKINDIA